MKGPARRFSWWMFHGHLWVGVVTGMSVLLISVTGVLLNHKRALGFMPDVDHTPTAPLEQALSLSALVERAEQHAGDDAAGTGVDRMDVRPADGLVKIRFRDRAVTEVTLDLASGALLQQGARADAFLEKLHSGEIFGSRGVLLSDLAAVALVLLSLSGIWLWLVPKARL